MCLEVKESNYFKHKQIDFNNKKTMSLFIGNATVLDKQENGS